VASLIVSGARDSRFGIAATLRGSLHRPYQRLRGGATSSDSRECLLNPV
jgi:hypothetical protein